MALTNPVDGWEMLVGTWGTDVDESTTVLRSGSRSIHFKNTTPVADPILKTTDFVPVEGGAYYTVEYWARADSTTAGNRLWVAVVWYDASESVISTSNFAQSVVGTVDTWEFRRETKAAPSGARLAIVRLVKDNNAFNGYFDLVRMRDAVPMWRISRASTAQSITNSGETVIFNTEDESVDVSVNTTTGKVTINTPGVYVINWAVFLQSMDQDEYVATTLVEDGGSTTIATGQIGYQSNSSAGGMNSIGTAVYNAAEGDVLRIDCSHGHGTDRDTDATGVATYFHGFRVE